VNNLPPAVRWLLLASLALNVALGAALALPWLASDHYKPTHSRMHGRDHMPSPRHLRRVLGEDRSTVVEAVMQRHRPHIRATFPPLREARRATHAAMAADPFDAAALERAFAELRERDARSTTAIQAMLAELMTQLTPAERAKIVASMPRRDHVRRRGQEAPRDARRDDAGSTQERRSRDSAPGSEPDSEPGSESGTRD
jgi:Spy/CpxP family protein refolding chaperone